MNKFIFFVFVLLLSSFGINGANVDIISEVGYNTTYFTYNLNFFPGDSFNKFSFEKPKNSIVISAVDGNNETLFYSIAGDFFIFKQNNDLSNYIIKFKTDTISKEIKLDRLYKSYLNFNFKVQNLTYKLNFKYNFGNYLNIFPRKYSILNNSNNNYNNSIFWKLNNIDKNTLFLINFNKDYNNKFNPKNNFNKSKNNININKNNDNKILRNSNNNIYLFLGGFFLIIIFLFFYFYRKLLTNLIKFNPDFYKKNNRYENNNNNNNNYDNGSNSIDNNQVEINNNSKFNLDNNSDEFEKNENNIDENLEENLDDFLSKYLTENESEVVLVVRENESMTQNEILSLIETMKKSNLSKIITKLDGKRILNRVRVGKVSKIYLGEKMTKFKIDLDD